MNTLLNILTGINVIAGLIILGGFGYLLLSIFRLYKRERIALFVGEDKLPVGYRVLKGTEKTFTHEKGRYVANMEPMLRFGNKRFLVYRYNHADPIDVLDKENSRLEADVLEGILSNEVIKALNKPKNALPFSLKTAVPIIIILVVLFIIFSGGGV